MSSGHEERSRAQENVMDIIDPSVQVEPKTITPTLRVSLTLHYKRGDEIPVDVFGTLRASDGKLIAPLQLIDQDKMNGFPLTAEDAAARYDNETRKSNYPRKVVLLVPLSEQHLDYIESLRDKDAKGDVTFVLHLNARCLATKVQTTPDKNAELRPMLVARNGEFISESIVQATPNVTIRSSDWVHDFAPALGIGRFIVMEI